jgi:hypothetical protein
MVVLGGNRCQSKAVLIFGGLLKPSNNLLQSSNFWSMLRREAAFLHQRLQDLECLDQWLL